jgi:hypothetical protein
MTSTLLPGSRHRGEDGDWIDREIESLRELVENGARRGRASEHTAVTIVDRESLHAHRKTVLHVLQGAYFAVSTRRSGIALYGLGIAGGILVGWLVGRA